MTSPRLQAELQRLYLRADEPAYTGAPRARALRLAIAGPGAWQALSGAWQQVQASLGWPAPGIAVSGRDGYELWFSLAEPVPVVEGERVLADLCRRCLGDVPAHRVACAVVPTGAAGSRLPPEEVSPGRWSAFVAPDLAALFVGETWLDLPPTEDAQADLLARLRPIAPAEWQAAKERLAADAATVANVPVPADGPPEAGALTVTPTAAPRVQQDPRRFLLDVMNDPGVDLRWRIEAAKALLPYTQP